MTGSRRRGPTTAAGTSGRGRRRRLVAGTLAAAGTWTGLALLPTVPAHAAEVTVTGHGYGHGRGMGQWGALGYAVDRGWTSRQLLDHYYGGTVAGTVPDLPISVELLSQRGRGAILTGTALTVDGRPTGAAAVLVERTGPRSYAVRTGPGCAGPWTPWATAAAGMVVASADRPEIELCEADRVRGYRGDMQLVERSDGVSALLNRVRVESYLRGVVPRESPASWADLGGGRGAQALRAQAVAARSYSLATPYSSYATTCDTITCQVYGGAWTRPPASATRTSLEDPRSDAAVAATAGEIRRSGSGAVVRTEFSASTGGWTAGDAFPAVVDEGDATAANPYHDWRATFTAADLVARLQVGELTGLRVTARNGLGADGGRVLRIVADTPAGPVTLTGNEVRQRLGLRSDWFTLPAATSAGQAQALVRGMWADLLGRPPAPGELAARTRELGTGRPTAALALDLATSAERIGHLVDDAYAGGLRRGPSPQDRAAWTRAFLTTGSLVELRAGIYGSAESLAVAGGMQAWVAQTYRGVLDREASPDERAGWAADAARRGQVAVVRDVAGSQESLRRRLDALYALLLQRAPDPGADGFVAELRGPGEITVPVGIAASPEYALRVLQRFPTP